MKFSDSDWHTIIAGGPKARTTKDVLVYLMIAVLSALIGFLLIYFK